MNRIVVVRHAQSEHHVGTMTGGWTDTDLTALGRCQANCLAERLKREFADTLCHLYCSDLKRAFQTAESIGHSLGIEPHCVPELREFNNGIAAGKTEEEAKHHAIEFHGAPLDWQPYPGAETWRAFYERVAQSMERLTAHQQGAVIVVTHGGTIINIVAWWLQLGVEKLSQVSFDADPASISVLRVNEWGERTIERLNDTAHLRYHKQVNTRSGVNGL